MPKTSYNANGLLSKVIQTSPETTEYGGEVAPRHFDVLLLHRDWPSRGCTLMVTVDPDRGPIASGLANSRRGKLGEQTDVLTYAELAKLLASTLDGDQFHSLLQKVTAEAVRDRYFRENSAGVLDGVDVTGWIHDDFVAATAEFDQEVREVEQRARSVTAPRRRRVVNSRHRQEVARVYREALERGEPPTKAVAEHFYASHSTAARWVGKARKTGELGPALGPRPGEETDR